MEFNSFKTKQLKVFEDYMHTLIDHHSQTELEESMLYSLFANGKRLRPLLLLATLEAFHTDVTDGYPAASALEMIHTYSLIHDDLPAMDDDDLRRGLPTNHLKFNEATAILAGDALLTSAFEVILSSDLTSEQNVLLVKLLSETAGYRGMIGGQMADIKGENQLLDLKDLEYIHSRKTGELLRFALEGAGIISNQPERVRRILGELGLGIGIAYQIRDDILDVVGTEEELGKPIGSDIERQKSTYPALLGLEGAYKYLDDALKNCLNKLADIEKEVSFNPTLIESFIKALALKESDHGEN